MPTKTLLAVAAAAMLAYAGSSEEVLRTGYHLTARPWKPLQIPAARYLDVIEGVCRFTAQHQDSSGAVIDPFLKREHQYATPYFAFAVGTLVEQGRALDLLPNGIRAMEHSTENFGGGRDTIPDRHGEFFIAALTESLPLYAPHVPAATLARWRERMRKPWKEVVRGSLNNWETYMMKGEWLRAIDGLAGRDEAMAAIEQSWKLRQCGRFAPAPWFLYHDRSSDPDTLSVEAVGRGNLLALTELGYNGPSSDAIRKAVEAGTRFTLLLQDPSGQVPANGRTDDHVWVDVGYQLAFEVMADRTSRAGDAWMAGQYRHAAMLDFQSIQRWRRHDGAWSGSFYVTKNHFDPALRVGYQTASQYSNYNGSLVFHLSEAFHARAHAVGAGSTENPVPAEIGGYALSTDAQFSSALVNAGGMQMQANLRGQIKETDGNWWTPLGVVRFARPNWDTRLGPSDGTLVKNGGVTFAPEFLENSHWLRMADLSARYRGEWSVEFVHPLLVRCSLIYRPKSGETGPEFRDDFVLTPDGVLSTVSKTAGAPGAWAVTWPVLENDGGPLTRSSGPAIRSVHYPGGTDAENFIALDASPQFDESPALLSTYGYLRPVRMTVKGEQSRTFVYPSGAGDPAAEAVRTSFRFTRDGFSSVLGRVDGSIYIGPTAAGGFGDRLDLNGDGAPEVTFSRPCGFLLQLRGGKILAVETDRPVEARIEKRTVRLSTYQPVRLAAN